jgi:2-dehydropantoate 2-reductase
MAPNLFSGPRDRAAAAVAALRAGGLPARLDRDVPARTSFLSSAFMAILLGLEEAGWSLARLRRTGLPLALAGARESMRVAAHTFGSPPLGMRLALWSPILRLVLRLAPRITPFPLEPYLRYHFTKVGAQTRHILGVAIERGRAAGLPVSAMEQLIAAAPPVSTSAAT